MREWKRREKETEKRNKREKKRLVIIGQHCSSSTI